MEGLRNVNMISIVTRGQIAGCITLKGTAWSAITGILITPIACSMGLPNDPQTPRIDGKTDPKLFLKPGDQLKAWIEGVGYLKTKIGEK